MIENNTAIWGCVIMATLTTFTLPSKATDINLTDSDATKTAQPVNEMVITVKLPTKSDNQTVDTVPALRRALQQAGRVSATHPHVRIVFPKARYDFYPEHCEKRKYFESNSYQRDTRICAIVIENMQNITIDGQGSDFIFHGPMQPITIDNSKNIHLLNFNIDWQTPLTAQAQVVDVSDKYIDIRVAKESPYILRNGKIVFKGKTWESPWWGAIEFAKDSHLIPQQSGDGCLGRNWGKYKAEELSPGLLRLHYSFTRKPAVGNYLVMRHSSRQHAGMFFFHSRDISLEKINIYHTAGLGLLGQFSENLSFNMVNIVPNPRKNRYFSGHDDGIHISNCKGRVLIQNCTFGGLMDDPINVHGTSVRIIKMPAANKLVCRFMHNMSTGMLWGRPGETIGFINAKSLSTIGKGTIKQWKPLNTDEFEITFSQAVPRNISIGDALENLTWAPEVRISHCVFNSCRARGVLLSTPRESVIEDSIFKSSGAAILIAGDANQWYESGAVNDLTIRGNVFESSCLTSWYQFGEGIISIFPEIPEPDPAKPFHHNIRIENNTFHAFDYPILYALSTDGLSFSDNTIYRNYDRKPWAHNKHMLTFAACKNIHIKGTRFVGDVLGQDILLKKMQPSELTVAPGQKLKVH